MDAQNLAVQNRLLTEDLKRRIDQLAAIGTVAASIGQSLDVDRTLEIALQAVIDIVGADAGGISMIDEATNEVVLRAQKGWTHDFVKTRPMRIPLGKGLSGRVIDDDDVLVFDDLTGKEEMAVPSFHDEHFRSIAMAPMHARGKIIGIISIMSLRPYSFSKDVIDVLRAIADTVGVALDNARLYETTVESENRLAAILYSTADGIIATDQSSRIGLINAAAEEMLGVNAMDVIGTPLRKAPIPKNVRSLLLFALSSRGEESQKVFQVNMDDGRVLSVLVSPVYVDPRIDQDSEMDGWVIVLQDVTHLRQAEMARTHFIQAAAHDMRNPLGVTLGSLDMLLSMLPEDSPDAQEVVEIAMRGVRRIQSLIDDLLNLEHIESGYGFQLSEVSIGDLVNELIADIRPSIDASGLTLLIDLPPTLPTFNLDKRWVQRAIMNYLDNACKYTPAGGRVTLRVFIKSSMLHVEVQDTGPGIPVEAQTRVFERFYRVKGSDIKAAGSGLGLAIVKSVAEAHGGGVYVRSRPPDGSTFGLTLRLPSE